MNTPGLQTAFETVSNLAATFQANEARYLSSDYQEAEVRKDFIDKFFIALGWDVNHDVQTNPYAQEVKAERTQGGSQRRADYAFYLAPNYRDVRFYVEAKKPYGDIATAGNYFQTIRYGSGSRTALGVLTDFEQFHILDCRFKADIKSVPKRCVRRYDCRDYTDREKFAEIYWLFSHEAVAGGALEKFAATLPKRGKDIPPPHLQNIDDAFLDDLEGYRATLARSFKKRNPRLDGSKLTEVTQRTLDRLVFMRFLEDRLIEPHHLVARLGATSSAWQNFVATSHRLDSIYNGIIFRYHDILDAPNFRADNEAFAEICQRLSDEYSPYDFDAIPVHILGSIYERFLGKVIVSTDKRVRVEQKPDVRRAGGVYYTPDYIVRYVVENTVGRLIEGKTPDRIAKMRFCDIACGSGSFLLGIYDLLLNYHGNYYNQNPGKARKGDCVRRDGKLYLSLLKKREILRNNIYGVDIDAQAVEVAQLSLYLKLLQEETTASTQQYLLEFEHTAQTKRLLPDLSRNIIRGNSLIGTDILDGNLFTADEETKLTPMDFEDAFPDVMKGGGFDAIVGNPPYVIISSESFLQEAIAYLNSYAVAQYKSDLFHLFLQRGIDTLRDDGLLGYIVPNPWLTNKFTERLRKYILDHCSVLEIDVLKHRVFRDADVHTALVFLQQGARGGNKVRVRELAGAGDLSATAQDTASLVEQSAWAQSEGFRFETRLVGAAGQVAARLVSKFPPLDSVARASLGCQAYNRTKHTSEQIAKRVFHATHKLSKEYLPELAGSDVSRYQIERERGEWIKYGPWLHDYRTMDWLQGPRILIREIPGRPPYQIQACYVEETYCNYKTILNVNPSRATTFSMKYLCGVLNSRLISFIYPLVSNKMVAQSFPRLSVADLRRLPVAPADNPHYDEIVQKVDAMLEAKKQLAKAKTDKDKTYYENRCTALDRQIDRLVYEIYSLTPKEITIVEKAGR